MKITITLSDAEAKGIKAYLQEDQDEPVTKEDIRRYVDNIVSCTIRAEHESVSDYISQFEKSGQQSE